MDIRDIRYFLKIAELCHLSRAADDLGVTQPALTKCVARLEDDFGVKLLNRSGRGIALTEAGQVLRDRFLLLDQDLSDIRKEVSELRSGLTGMVRIGCSASIANYVLPKICKRVRETAPALQLTVRVAMDDALRDDLRAGVIDMTISPERATPADEALVSRVLLSDAVVVVAHRGHPLVGQNVTLQDLAEQAWVLPMPTVSTRRWLDEVFRKAGLPPPFAAVTAAPLVSAPPIMAQTDMLSFMSRRNLISGELVEIPNQQTTLQRNFEVSHRARGFLAPSLRFFIALLERELANVASA
ncbi:LysR family transcriptional regulator [Paracoccus laeviglucosivorans]|uniref:Transcriptional regulator, LysR family n=1 Tax=Paracoccus laeviglucosivorans TaxID=1197861 RepID=A0A521EN57_9RHOB|nr:LysR family transcriptional regulator [Paracoccus laeviglucosivorans]SMO85324.1 transcriptional regulator, LysR family [Paracoccus laeviglucosivorans]